MKLYRAHKDKNISAIIDQLQDTNHSIKMSVELEDRKAAEKMMKIAIKTDGQSVLMFTENTPEHQAGKQVAIIVASRGTAAEVMLSGKFQESDAVSFYKITPEALSKLEPTLAAHAELVPDAKLKDYFAQAKKLDQRSRRPSRTNSAASSIETTPNSSAKKSVASGSAADTSVAVLASKQGLHKTAKTLSAEEAKGEAVTAETPLLQTSRRDNGVKQQQAEPKKACGPCLLL